MCIRDRLNTLIQGGYHAFAENELEQRQAAGFPPFAHLALLRAEAKHAEAAEAFLRIAKSLCSAEMQNTDMEIQGPLPAPMQRRAGMHRMQLLLSSTTRRNLHALSLIHI